MRCPLCGHDDARINGSLPLDDNSWRSAGWGFVRNGAVPAAPKPDAAPPPPPYNAGSVGAPIHYQTQDGGGERPVVSQAPAPSAKTETAPDLAERKRLISNVRANINAEIRKVDDAKRLGAAPGDEDRKAALIRALGQLDVAEKQEQFPIVGGPSAEVVNALVGSPEAKKVKPEVILATTKQVAADGSVTYPVSIPKDQTSSTDSSVGQLATPPDATFHKHAHDPSNANNYPGPADPVQVLSTKAPVIYADGEVGGAIGYDGKKFTLTPVAGLRLPSYANKPPWMKATFEPW